MTGTRHSIIPSAQYSKRTNDMRKSSIRQGFTLIECLIGLAISAMLLAAVAVAFNASVINYAENERMYKVINNARQALARMTGEIRTCGYLVDPDNPATLVSVPMAVPANQCKVYRPNGELVTYDFSSADQKLYLTVASGRYLLCDKVTGATFDRTTVNGIDATSVEISLTVRSGSFQRSLSAAAVVRKNLGL